MKINPVNGVGYNMPVFGRKLKKGEKKSFEHDVLEGLNSLDKKMTIILPSNCSPSKASKDVGVGQPYSKSSNEMLYPFLATMGFTQVQKHPAGLGKPTDASPYVSNSSAYNTAIIDLEELTEPSMGSILSKTTYNKIVKNNPTKGQNRTSYTYHVHANKEALKEAYDTFEEKIENLDSLSPEEKDGILALNDEFEKFLEEHGQEQEKNALYSVLTEIHGNDYWPNWDSVTDKNLFSKKGNSNDLKLRKDRLEELREDYSDDINCFLFSQMLAKRTIDEGNKKVSIKSIGDVPVGFSDAEKWGNRDIFLDNYVMGCQEPWNKGAAQRWGFPVLDPDKLFNKDGSLGEAGKFLYNKYARVFKENQAGVRIDHILGLMDPYVYNPENYGQDGRLYTQIYKGVNGDDCGRILRDIVLKAAHDTGLDSSNIIAEDLGYMPDFTKDTLRKLNIGGVTVTQWSDDNQIKHAPKNNAVMVSNHDTETAAAKYNKWDRKREFTKAFSSNARNLHIFWPDLMGMKERYNEPGKVGDKNWSLRLTPDFEDVYYQKVKEDEALNIPQTILDANRMNDPSFDRHKPELAKNLSKWAGVLKE